MQCNMLTIYYYAYVCSCTCCVANRVTLTLFLLLAPFSASGLYDVTEHIKSNLHTANVKCHEVGVTVI